MKKLLAIFLPLIFSISSFALTGPRVEVGANFELNNLVNFKTNKQFSITGYVNPMWQHKFNSNNEINFGPKIYLGYIGNFDKSHNMKIQLLGTLEYAYRINNTVKVLGGLDLGVDSSVTIVKGAKNYTLDIVGSEGLGIYGFGGVRLYDKIGLSLLLGYSTVYELSFGMNLGYKF